MIKPAEKGCMTGAFLGLGTPMGSKIRTFQAKTGMTPKILMWFHAFSIGFDFPGSTCKAVEEAGGIPFIKLEPWSCEGRKDRSFSLDRIIRGELDEEILWFARGVRRWERPIFITFGHEMNGTWYPWAGNPRLYKKAFARVHRLFAKAKAENQTWVFNPNADPVEKIGDYYPGDKLVDWIALDGFNWGSTQTWSKWQSFEEIFSKPIRKVKDICDKPLMIGEFASAESGGDKAAWIREAFEAMRAMKEIKACVWFNIKKETDWQLDSSEKSLKAYSEAVRHEHFL